MSAGLEACCPFCLGKSNPWPEVGTRLLFLDNYEIGRTGVVDALRAQNLPLDRFLVSLDGERPGVQHMIMPSNTTYIEADVFRMPAWMPPVSVLNLSKLHSVLPSRLSDLFFEGQPSLALTELVAVCWYFRLPINGSELWPFLAAHGAAERNRSRVVEFFDFGFQTCVAIAKRKPVKKYRQKPGEWQWT